MNLLEKMIELRNKVEECNQMCREMGTDWEVVLKRKEAFARVVVKMYVQEKIATIKAIRDVMNWNLINAKRAVDEAYDRGEYELFRSPKVAECDAICDKLRDSCFSIRDNFQVILNNDVQ